MAIDVAQAEPRPNMAEEEMTDEQMEELLNHATIRLKEREGLRFQNEEPARYTFPQLDAGNLEKAYVTKKGEVAEADKARLLEEKDRQPGHGIRKMEDPVAAKKLAAEVRIHLFFLPPSYTLHEENNPNLFISSRVGVPFWCLSANMRVFIHSYSDYTPTIHTCLHHNTVIAATDRLRRRRKLPPAPHGTTFLRPTSPPSSSVTCNY